MGTPEAAKSETPEPAKPKASRGRRVFVAILVVLGCILAPLSVLSVWMKTVLLDTDSYVATVAPLAHDSNVQNAVANRVTNTLVANNNVEQRIVDRLPAKAKFIGPKIEGALSSAVHDVALQIVKSDQFAKLWKEANRRAHTQIVNLLEGKSPRDAIQTKNGEIVLDVGTIAEKVNSALQQHGIDAFSTAAQNASSKQVVLVQSVWLKRSQNATNLLQELAIVLPILTLLCFAVAIWLSPRRRRTVLRSALGLALGLALLLIAFNSGRHFYLGALPSTVNSAAASTVYDQLLSALRLALRTGFVLALVVALAAWLAGPARPATRIREGVLNAVRGHGAAGGEPTAFASFMARHRRGLRIVCIGLGLIVLVALDAPTPVQVLVIAGIVLLAVLLVEFLGRRAIVTPATEGADA